MKFVIRPKMVIRTKPPIDNSSMVVSTPTVDVAEDVPAPVVEQEVIKPQPGPQTAFFESNADIVIYGGAAGGGKSYALLMEALRYIFTHEGMTVIILRRDSTMLRQAGGLWEKACTLYRKLGGVSRESPDMSFTFPPYGNKVIFDSCQYDKDVESHQGGQYCLVAPDELTHFTQYQFFYFLSRNRSTCGVKAYVRATCNPDSESWVAEFIAWWIDQNTGYPIKERSGVIRHMLRIGDDIKWFDSPQSEKDPVTGHAVESKSVTFIPADLTDNKILMESDPGYMSTLHALGSVERERLLKSNWKIAHAGGSFFKADWWKFVDSLPELKPVRRLIYWDRAATEKKGDNNPDATCGVHINKYKDGFNVYYIIAMVVHFRGAPMAVEHAVLNYAITNPGIETWLEQEPGSAGVNDISNMRRLLDGHIVKINKPSADKATRALPLSSAVEGGRVFLLRGAWNGPFISECAAFGPDPKKYAFDDQPDAASGGYNSCQSSGIGPRILELG